MKAQIRGSSGDSVLKVGFLLSRSFTLSAFSLFVDTLRLASDTGDRSGRIRCDWSVMSASGQLVRSSCGVQVAPTSRLQDPAAFDYIVVVGGLLAESQPLDDETVHYLKGAARSRNKIIGVCTGSFVLASLGLMRHRTTCVSWLHYRDFVEAYPDHAATSRQLFVEDKGIITCAGGSAAADLAAELVHRHVGQAAERNALEILQIDRRRTGADIQPRNPLHAQHGDPRIRAAITFMENNLERQPKVEQIAASIGVSRRQMERLFKDHLGVSPVAALMQVRMEHAVKLLSTTSRPLIDIALDTGFNNASHLAKRFRRAYGITPTVFRKDPRVRFESHVG